MEGVIRTANLTKEELEVLQGILDKQGLIKKGLLKSFIWMNTVEPTYKVDEIISFTDLHERFWGVPLRNVGAKVKAYQFDKSSKTIIYVVDFTMINKETGKELVQENRWIREEYIRGYGKSDRNYVIPNDDVEQCCIL